VTFDPETAEICFVIATHPSVAITITLWQSCDVSSLISVCSDLFFFCTYLAERWAGQNMSNMTYFMFADHLS